MYILDMIKTVVYGVVEGVTEWLPISSTGHLILLERILPMNISPAFFEVFKVVIQLGAILAVMWLYQEKLNPFSPKKNAAEKKNTIDLWLKVVIASVPIAILGLFLDDLVEAHLSNNITIASTLILYGVLFIIVERRNKDREPSISQFKQLSYQTAALIGCFQVLTIIPGTSRSGATILAAIFLGTSRYIATEFSFFLGIPAMFGASAVKLLKSGLNFSFGDWGLLLIGMVVSFIVSVIFIKLLIGYVKRHDFTVFGWYRIVLGIIVLALTFF